MNDVFVVYGRHYDSVVICMAFEDNIEALLYADNANKTEIDFYYYVEPVKLKLGGMKF